MSVATAFHSLAGDLLIVGARIGEFFRSQKAQSWKYARGESS